MTTARPPATAPADSPAAQLRGEATTTLRRLLDLYLELQPRDLRRAIPTASRALGWDWTRLAVDLVDRIDDVALRYLLAVAYDRLHDLIDADPRVLAADTDDTELRGHVLEQLRRALA